MIPKAGARQRLIRRDDSDFDDAPIVQTVSVRSEHRASGVREQTRIHKKPTRRAKPQKHLSPDRDDKPLYALDSSESSQSEQVEVATARRPTRSEW